MNECPFIAFEGIDGSGKTTQARLLAQRLLTDGHKIYTTFEPTDSFIGVQLRAVFKGQVPTDHKTIAALFLADRLHHIQNKTDGLLQQLQEGFTVISDRYYFSSYAYHAVHVDQDWVIAANSLCAELCKPTVTIFIDTPPQVAMNRIKERTDGAELYESLENLIAVRNYYYTAFEKLKNKENVVIIHPQEDIKNTASLVWEAVLPYIACT